MKVIIFLIMIMTLGPVKVERAGFIKFDLDSIENNLCHKDRSMKVEIGDSTKAEFQPEMKISAWGNECLFKVDLRTDTSLKDIVPSVTEGRLSFPLRKGELSQIYRRADGNLEWEVVLSSIPDTNVFEFRFESRGLQFMYQDTSKFDSALKVNSVYPDSTVFSWIAYHNSRRDNRIKIDANNDTTRENYYGGIAFTIYRPRAIDSDGHSIWCQLNIDTVGNVLSLEIPQKFLNEAVYPVTVDPTIGNSTQEGFYTNLTNWAHMVLHNFSDIAIDDGTLINAFIYSYNNDSNYACTVQVGVYTYDANVANCSLITISSKIPVKNFGSGSIQWNSAVFSGTDTIDSGGRYIVSFIPYSSGNNNLHIAYGFSSWGDIKYSSGSDWTFPRNLAGYQSTNCKWAVYAEYTIGESADKFMRRRRIIGGGKR